MKKIGKDLWINGDLIEYGRREVLLILKASMHSEWERSMD